MNCTSVESTKRRCWLYIIIAASVIYLSLAGALLLDDAQITHEFGPMQLAGAAFLAAALLGIVHRLLRDGASHRLAPVWVASAFVLFFLTWREIEIDKYLFGLHAFSWKYIIESQTDLATKFTLGLPSIGLSLTVAVYLVIHRSRFARGLIQPWPRMVVALAAAGVTILMISQLWDKGASIHRHLSIAVFERPEADPLPEEIFELLGEQLLFLCVVELHLLSRSKHPALASDDPRACPPDRVKP